MKDGGIIRTACVRPPTRAIDRLEELRAIRHGLGLASLDSSSMAEIGVKLLDYFDPLDAGTIGLPPEGNVSLESCRICYSMAQTPWSAP